MSSYDLRTVVLVSAIASMAAALAGCGTAASCSGGNVVEVSPAVATADHMAAAPGDQQQFSAYSSFKPSATSTGCAIPQVIAKLTPTWTVSDPTNVRISSAQDATNGLATCLGTTKSPVTVSAIGTPASGGPSQTLATATLTCK
jgi:hypothetical protein